MTDKGGIFVSIVIEKRDEIARQVFDVVVGHVRRQQVQVGGRGGGGGYMGSIVNGRVAASQVIAKQEWNGAEKTFDVAPREAFQIRRVVDGAATVQGPSTDTLTPKRYQRTIDAADLSPVGELSGEASVRLLSDAANAYIEENKSFLSKSWPDLNGDATWHTSFFQMRFVFVPFAVLTPGDTVSIEVAFEPSASGKGQFTQDIYLEASGKKLANAGGRVIIREM